jgi:hypothetical protein
MSGPMQSEAVAGARPSPVGGMMLAARVLPEGLSLALALMIAIRATPAWFATEPQLLVQWVVMTEAVTLMFLCTVIDIASRLRRAPPWWAGVLICAGVLLVYPQVPQLLLAALDEGLWIALPFVWSILERLREIWTLPGQPRIEKLRRRALTFGRLYSGLMVGVSSAVGVIAATLLITGLDGMNALVASVAPWCLVAFFGLSLIDTVRVHRPAFVARPVSLWPRIDGGQTDHLDPL